MNLGEPSRNIWNLLPWYPRRLKCPEPSFWLENIQIKIKTSGLVILDVDVSSLWVLWFFFTRCPSLTPIPVLPSACWFSILIFEIIQIFVLQSHIWNSPRYNRTNSRRRSEAISSEVSSQVCNIRLPRGHPSFMRHRSLYSEGCRIFFQPIVKKKGKIQQHLECPDQAGFGWAVLLFLSRALPLGHIGNLLQPGNLTSEGVSHLWDLPCFTWHSSKTLTSPSGGGLLPSFQ